MKTPDDIHRRWRKTDEGWETISPGPSDLGVRVSAGGEVSAHHRDRLSRNEARWLGNRLIEAAAVVELLTGGTT